MGMPSALKQKIVPTFRYAVPQSNLESRVVFIQMLSSEKIALRSPLALTIESAPHYTIASNADFALFGYGDTESEAIRDFTRSLEEFYTTLKNNKKNSPDI